MDLCFVILQSVSEEYKVIKENNFSIKKDLFELGRAEITPVLAMPLIPGYGPDGNVPGWNGIKESRLKVGNSSIPFHPGNMPHCSIVVLT